MADNDSRYADDPAFALHEGGKMEIAATVPLAGREDLSLAYTPGVARVCEAIAEDPALLDRYTWVANTVAVVTDGSAVLGLGNIGPRASMPVMEGKAVLFKAFGGVDAVPITLDTQDTAEIIETVVRLAPGFGGDQPRGHLGAAVLRDRGRPQAAPGHPRLPRRPARHGGGGAGGAAATRSAHRPALRDHPGRRLRGRRGGRGRAPGSCSPPGSATSPWSTARACCTRTASDLNPVKAVLAARHGVDRAQGRLADVLAGADVLVGVSGGTIPEELVATMAPEAIIFGLANPTPEVMPEVAHRHARVVATGRSDFPNQINNVLAFPGIFRGALDARASAITEAMKLAAAEALADAGRRRAARGAGHPVAVRPAGRDPPGRAAVAEAAARGRRPRAPRPDARPHGRSRRV